MYLRNGLNNEDMTNIQEIWEPIPYAESYQVSNLGSVRTVSRKVNSSVQPCGFRVTTPKNISIFDNGRGYKVATTQIQRQKKNYYVHRLVAERYVPNPLNLPEVNHKDGDKSNNAFWNLEWVDRLGNLTHAIDNGLRPVKTILNTETGIFYDNVWDAMKSFGYNRSVTNFRRIVRGKYPTIKLPFIYA